MAVMIVCKPVDYTGILQPVGQTVQIKIFQQFNFVLFANLVCKKVCIANRFVVGAYSDGRVGTLELEQVIFSKNMRNVFWNRLFRRFLNDQKIDVLIVFPKRVFREKLKKINVITEFNFDSSGGGHVSVTRCISCL